MKNESPVEEDDVLAGAFRSVRETSSTRSSTAVPERKPLVRRRANALRRPWADLTGKLGAAQMRAKWS